MGNRMGNRIVSSIIATIIRPIRNFNVERRAHKVISKAKPIAAPQYEATKNQLKLSQKLEPEFMEKHNKKDAKLYQNLKDVFVIAEDPVADLSHRSDPTKPLPKSRKSFEYADFNLYKIQNVREGRCSLHHVQTILTNYMNDPKKHNPENIAEQYKLDKKVVDNILEYYGVFRVIRKGDINKTYEKEDENVLDLLRKELDIFTKNETSEGKKPGQK